MSLNDISLGSGIFIKEDGVDTEYVVINKDSQGAELIRAELNSNLKRGIYDTISEEVYQYDGSDLDVWLNGDFLNRFSSNVLSNIANRNTYWTLDGVGTVVENQFTRKCYLFNHYFDSRNEVIYTESLSVYYGVGVPGSLYSYVTVPAKDENGIYRKWWTMNESYNSGISGYSCDSIYTWDGEFGYLDPDSLDDENYVRPMINFSLETPVRVVDNKFYIM